MKLNAILLCVSVCGAIHDSFTNYSLCDISIGEIKPACLLNCQIHSKHVFDVEKYSTVLLQFYGFVRIQKSINRTVIVLKAKLQWQKVVVMTAVAMQTRTAFEIN